jgi:hypothetical protein
MKDFVSSLDFEGGDFYSGEELKKKVTNVCSKKIQTVPFKLRFWRRL